MVGSSCNREEYWEGELGIIVHNILLRSCMAVFGGQDIKIHRNGVKEGKVGKSNEDRQQEGESLSIMT